MTLYLALIAAGLLGTVSGWLGAWAAYRPRRRPAGAPATIAVPAVALAELVAAAISVAYHRNPATVTGRLAVREALSALPDSVYKALDLEKVSKA